MNARAVITSSLLIACWLVQAIEVSSQDLPPSTEEQVENLGQQGGEDAMEDLNLSSLASFLERRLNLNEATESELASLNILTPQQIIRFMEYRRQLGSLVSIYELQAVPGWPITLIRALIPYVQVSTIVPAGKMALSRFRGGDYQLSTRISAIVERSRGYKEKIYLGSNVKLLTRYRYQFKNLLQYGVTMEKDAGEFLFTKKPVGFDFLSYHIFLRQVGNIRCLALGDFTVSMGQGLIQWQGLSFKKGADLLVLKRQASVLAPYSGAGEFEFFKGLGLTLQRRSMEITGFLSLRNLDASIHKDSLGRASYFSSYQASGNHRTINELEDRHALRQFVGGGAVSLRIGRWKGGVNSIFIKNSLEMRKDAKPYNLYAMTGDRWMNASIHYELTVRSVHFFGEAAVDKLMRKAFIQGILWSMDSRADLAILYRRLSVGYQSLYGNAFTVNSSPGNETGLYLGINIRPSAAWKISLYADHYQFPWLKFGVDGPSGGRDYLVQLNYNPDRQTELYSKFRTTITQASGSEAGQMKQLVIERRITWRIHFAKQLNRSLQFRNRVEASWFSREGSELQAGFLILADCVYKPMLKPLQVTGRLQYFETDGYDSRIYAYENDVLASFSVPGFDGRGSRYYLLINYDMNRAISCWLRWGQIFYYENRILGSGYDEIRGSKKSEWKFQVRFFLKGRERK